MVRSIVLRYEDETFKRLQNEKEEQAINEGKKISWEEFFKRKIFKKVNKGG